jgi:hypothetical protein
MVTAAIATKCSEAMPATISPVPMSTDLKRGSLWKTSRASAGNRQLSPIAQTTSPQSQWMLPAMVSAPMPVKCIVVMPRPMMTPPAATCLALLCEEATK